MKRWLRSSRYAPAAEGTPERLAQLRDIHELARGVMQLARSDAAKGLNPEDALALAFEKIAHFEHIHGDSEGVTLRLAEVAGLLMDMGVLNVMTLEQIRAAGVTAEVMDVDPALMVRLPGVKSLRVWP